MIQLDLQPEVEARLAAEADAQGLALNRYVEQIVMALADDPREMRLGRELEVGLREIAEGNTVAAREVFTTLRQDYDIRG